VARRAKKKATKRARARAGDGRTIVAVAGAEPPRPGGVGRAHYDRAVGKTVAKYLASFPEGPERRYARAWMHQWINREGRVRLK
jgi:hypothetical protein